MAQDPNIDRDAFRNQQLRSAQTLLSVAMISAPVSLLIGGVLLDVVAIVCACVARGKIKSARAIDDAADISLNLYRQSTIALAVAITACVVNLIFMVIALITVYDMAMNGTLDRYIDSFMEGNPQIPEDGSGSVWDA